MNPFTQDSLKFWRGLAKNNNKAWFDEHRAEYQTHLKDPYTELVNLLVDVVRDREPEFVIDPKKAAYRINRDLRFSKDKSPYKTELGITIGREQKHEPNYPSYTARVGVNGIAIAGGLYMPDPPVRDAVRRFVAENSTELRDLLAEPAFVDLFGDLGGESNKRLPPDLKDLADGDALVYNKQWVYWSGYEDPDLLFHDDLVEFIGDHWDTARPVNEFFKRAVSTA